MKLNRDLLVLLTCALTPFLGSAALFDREDFNDGIRNFEKWAWPDQSAGYARLVETNSHLEFVASSRYDGNEAWATWAAGIPATMDWEISVDVAIAALPLRPNEFANWELIIFPSGMYYQNR